MYCFTVFLMGFHNLDIAFPGGDGMILKKLAGHRWIGIFSLGLSSAIWYTLKIDYMDREGKLSLPGYPILEWWDLAVIADVAAFLFLILVMTLPRLAHWQWKRSPRQGHKHFYLAALFMFLWQIPFLLAFYPAPGMNDTVFMINHPLYGSVQFPWLYSLIYGYGAFWGRQWIGTAEPIIFLLSLIQLGVMTFTLTRFCYWVINHYHEKMGWGLYLFFTLWPMVGNYDIAAVRDGIFSLSLLLWMWLFLLFRENPRWDRKRYILLIAALLGTMLFRNNGIILSVILTGLLVYQYGNRYIWIPCLLSMMLAIFPARWIQEVHHFEPLFQESMAIPLQQLGRTLVTNGTRSKETVDMMDGILKTSIWKETYSPYTVDFVKWHDDFKRHELNQEKGKFLRLWLETGIDNPRIYIEGWLTETYALWNVDPMEYGVQSRFGWALSDDNTAHMVPADNDRMAVGHFPMPMFLKSILARIHWEGSHFLGTGLCLWMTLWILLMFHLQQKNYGLGASPLLLNTAILLLSTPASSVFRYSFSYVLCLPVLCILIVLKDK